jgi:hypothetical protein
VVLEATHPIPPQYIIEYKGSTDYKKKKACDFNNGFKIIKPFRKRNSTLIFGGRERQSKYYSILEMCQPGLPSLISSAKVEKFLPLLGKFCGREAAKSA